MKTIIASTLLALSTAATADVKLDPFQIASLTTSQKGVFIETNVTTAGMEGCSAPSGYWIGVSVDDDNYETIAETMKYAYRNDLPIHVKLRGCVDPNGWDVPRIQAVYEDRAAQAPLPWIAPPRLYVSP